MGMHGANGEAQRGRGHWVQARPPVQFPFLSLSFFFSFFFILSFSLFPFIILYLYVLISPIQARCNLSLSGQQVCLLISGPPNPLPEILIFCLSQIIFFLSQTLFFLFFLFSFTFFILSQVIILLSQFDLGVTQPRQGGDVLAPSTLCLLGRGREGRDLCYWCKLYCTGIVFSYFCLCLCCFCFCFCFCFVYFCLCFVYFACLK